MTAAQPPPASPGTNAEPAGLVWESERPELPLALNGEVDGRHLRTTTTKAESILVSFKDRLNVHLAEAGRSGQQGFFKLALIELSPFALLGLDEIWRINVEFYREFCQSVLSCKTGLRWPVNDANDNVVAIVELPDDDRFDYLINRVDPPELKAREEFLRTRKSATILDALVDEVMPSSLSLSRIRRLQAAIEVEQASPSANWDLKQIFVKKVNRLLDGFGLRLEDQSDGELYRLRITPGRNRVGYIHLQGSTTGGKRTMPFNGAKLQVVEVTDDHVPVKKPLSAARLEI